jgi:hypothetical protein
MVLLAVTIDIAVMTMTPSRAIAQLMWKIHIALLINMGVEEPGCNV